MSVIKFNDGDILMLKKKHPCGNDKFKVTRCGSDVRIICIGCKRDLTLPRISLEKMIKETIKQQE